MKEIKIPGLVHRLLNRKEWAGQPGAYEAIKKEKDGLVDVGAWLEEEIVSKGDVLAWATRTSNVVHFGNLMIMLSVKGSELSPDQWRLEARIVFRGDDIRHQSGMSAVFEELFASSLSSLEGLNTAVAFGLLESHGVTPCEPTLRRGSKPDIVPMFCYRLSSSHRTRNTSSNLVSLSIRRFTDILKALPIGSNIFMRFC